MKLGERFNPWRGSCGFYPPDVIAEQRKLTSRTGSERECGDGPKRVYERLVRFAGTQGKTWYSQKTLAEKLGKSERQVRYDLGTLEDFGLIERARKRGARHTTVYFFLWHSAFEQRQSTAVEENLPDPDDPSYNGNGLPFSPDLNGNPLPLKNRPSQATTAKNGTNNGKERHEQRQYIADELGNETSNELNPPPLGSLELVTEEEDAALGKETPNPSEEIAKLTAYLFEFRVDRWGDSTLAPPTQRFVRDLLACAPGWTAAQVIDALEVNKSEARCKPQSYRWFLTTVARIYMTRNGEAPELRQNW